MIEWPMIFLGGILGSSHCIGMCGGFALALGSARPGLAANLARQTAYGLGRVFTYSSAGAAVGYGGWRLMGELGTVVNVQAVLCVAAGVLLVIEGLASANVVPRVHWMPGSAICPSAGLFGSLLRATRLRSAFLGGVINGLLPCGLVYAYLALAASSGGVWQGWGTMAAFGLGTVPTLVLVGCGGTALSGTWRLRVFRLAAWCVVLTGVISVARGLGFSGTWGPPGCPGCHG